MHTNLRNSENLKTAIITRCIHRKDKQAPINLPDNWTCYTGSKEACVREFFNVMKNDDAAARNAKGELVNMDDLLERVLSSADYSELKPYTFESKHKAFTDILTVAEVAEMPESSIIGEMIERLKSLPAELISIERFDPLLDYDMETVSHRDGKYYYGVCSGEKAWEVEYYELLPSLLNTPAGELSPAAKEFAERFRKLFI